MLFVYIEVIDSSKSIRHSTCQNGRHQDPDDHPDGRNEPPCNRSWGDVTIPDETETIANHPYFLHKLQKHPNIYL